MTSSDSSRPVPSSRHQPSDASWPSRSGSACGASMHVIWCCLAPRRLMSGPSRCSKSVDVCAEPCNAKMRIACTG